MTDDEIQPNLDWSEYPICYDVSNTDERPRHGNWVIPVGTRMLVDFDHVVRLRIAQELHRRDVDFRKRVGLPPEEER